MTIAITKTATIIGIDAHIIDVEADVRIGLGNFTIVGLPDGAIKESRERIIAALNSACDGFPIRKIVVNLAPADIKKMGTGFDLPIAMAILEANQVLPRHSLSSYVIIGELSLEGKIRPINGILAIALAAQKAGATTLIVPVENGAAASMIESLKILTVSNIGELVAHFKGEKALQQYEKDGYPIFDLLPTYDINFSDVKGQETAKRALEIAAAGKHHALLSGPPGSGKSMLSKRLPGILPPLIFNEAIEVTQIHSVAGTIANNQALVQIRPFRNPHHTISGAGLVGGGSIPKPGEVSLAHHGVLFLDELPEFPRNILDLLRQPLEDKKVVISRVNSTLTFPCDYLLLAAMNPCPCGYLGDPGRECSCSASSVIKYRSRISGPILDRIDIQVEMPLLSYEELSTYGKGESSEQIRKRIMLARQRQLHRFRSSTTRYNSDMNQKQIEAFCAIKAESHQLLARVLKRFRLSGRAHDSILKVSRTIADLDGEERIEPSHIAEAVNYRCLDKEVAF